MKKSTIYLLVLATVTLFTTYANAQGEKQVSPKKFNSWSIGVSVGPTTVYGDYSPKVGGDNLFDKNFGFAFGGLIAKSFTPVFALQGNLQMGSLKGGNEDPAPHNFEFKTKIKYQYTLSGVFTFGNISYFKRVLPKLNFYTSLGAGMMTFDPNTTINGVALEEGGDYRYPNVYKSWDVTTEMVFPMALGAKYKLTRNLAVFAEYNLVSTWSDKIDDRRNLHSKYDKYAYMNAGVAYTFGKKEKSMDWVNPLEDMLSTVSDVKGKMDSLGGDKDNDGVADMYDRDNATPNGVMVYGNGTSTDTDMDGVPDATDTDPFSDRGSKVDATGKQLDNDGDGVYNERDLEPATEKGKLVNFQGITIKHPEATAGGGGGGGGISDLDKYAPLIYFDLDQAVVKSSYFPELAKLARIMKANPAVKVTLFGHCDAPATDKYNTVLGQKRAENTRKYLKKVYGIEESRITCISKGKTEPFSNPDNKKNADPLNRRVDFKID